MYISQSAATPTDSGLSKALLQDLLRYRREGRYRSTDGGGITLEAGADGRFIGLEKVQEVAHKWYCNHLLASLRCAAHAGKSSSVGYSVLDTEAHHMEMRPTVRRTCYSLEFLRASLGGLLRLPTGFCINIVYGRTRASQCTLTNVHPFSWNSLGGR